jgi:hypothetical protein
VELVNSQGRVVATAAFELSGMDSAMQFSPDVSDQPDATVRVSLPAGYTPPEAWVLGAQQ